MAVKKKIVSSLVAFNLLAASIITPVSLQADWVSSNMMGNETPSSTWTDERTGVSYTNFGSMTYKFKRNNNYAPWFEAKSPSGGVSCSGFSFDLGFLGIMNLRAIEEQLSDAGESFMWGLLTVFKLSTPTLESIFEYINEIVRQIQDLHRNACALGTTLASSMSKRVTGESTVDVLAGVDEMMLGKPVDQVKEFSDSSMKEKLDEYFIELGNKTAAEKHEAISKIYQSDTLGVLNNEKFRNTPLSIIEHTLETYIKANKNSFTRPTISEFTVSDILNKTIKVTTSDGNSNDVSLLNKDYFSVDQMVANLAIYMYLVGTVTVNKDDAARILSTIPELGISDTDYEQFSKDKAEDAIRAVEPKPIEGAYWSGSEANTASEIISFLMEGNGDKIVLQNLQARVVIMAPTLIGDISTGLVKPEIGYFFVDDSVGATNQTIEYAFSGLEKGSRDGLNSLFNRFHIDANKKLVNSKLAVADSDMTVPVMYSGLGKKANILDRFFIKRPYDKYKIEKMANTLIQVNSLMAAQEILEATLAFPMDKTAENDIRIKNITKAIQIIEAKIQSVTGGSIEEYDRSYEILENRLNGKYDVSTERR